MWYSPPMNPFDLSQFTVRTIITRFAFTRFAAVALPTAGLCVCAAVGGATLLGCASQTRVPLPIRQALNDRHKNETVELRQSCYYGDLYDENEKWLLSPRPFAETYHIVDTKGAPIHPKNQAGIIPAGAKFVVDRIEFPDFKAMTARMLTSPRYHTWVYLTPAADNTQTPRERTFFILLLPMDLETETSVEESFGKLVAPVGAVTRWLTSLRPTARVAVEHKDVITGMTLTEVVASQGEPERWFYDADAVGRLAVAWYPSRELWLRDNTVIEIRPARHAPPAAVPVPAPAPTDTATVER